MDERNPQKRLIVTRLWEAQLAFEARLVEGLAGVGMTLAEFRLVGELLREPAGLRQGELARRLGVRPPTVSTAVARLLAGGVLEQTMDEQDQRARRVRIAKKATTRVGFTLLEQLERIALDGVSARSAAQLAASLETLTRNLQKAGSR